MSAKTHRCPCCGYLTLQNRGANEICPVCYWEDDGQDIGDLDTVRGGPNGKLSLRDAMIAFARYGAVEERFKSKVRKPLPEEI
ncbi:MAG TPA: CPCC family cysteine-rich protein [Rhizomicrobium sp.]